MKAVVNRDECIGCGVCADTCPEVFEMDEENLVAVIATPVPKNAEDTCKDAADNCPVEAISVEE
jgi:ferredoxin